ncbi:hypothetical protein SAMN05192574_105327 [Mucilaginibacter gossypiicola]|uniref:Uncharacterized protein n=1 Tax=Mucilaginibacter gossypiicola TaxID=551995 RepID=A0A1H8LZY0_9SPHI|nr:hypothetical protein [Mucilaginibacter gossypiicola]SEO10692.1 hypothetical protein SAMN05192574_105327 [Mucilaginibacter gossypiicola]
MEKPFEIIEIDGAEHVVSLENSFMLKVIPPNKRADRDLTNYSIYSCVDNTIGVVFRGVELPEKLFPVDLIYDFKGIDIKFQDGDWVEPNFLLWFEAIEYYGMARLNVSRDNISGLEFHGEICVDKNGLRSYPALELQESENIDYDFQFIDGDGKEIIYLTDGTFSMSVEQRQPDEVESGPVLSATLYEPFVDGEAIRFDFEEWEIRANFVFRILNCDQVMDGFMRPKQMYFDAIDFYFKGVLGTSNYQAGLPYHSYMFRD